MKSRLIILTGSLAFLAIFGLYNVILAGAPGQEDSEGTIGSEQNRPQSRGPIAPIGFHRNPNIVDPEVIRLADAYNEFGLELLGQIRSTDIGENIFISPASAAFALAMVYNGAEEETKTAMARALAVDGSQIDTFNAANRSLAERLNNWADIELAIANSIWMSDKMTFKDEFLTRVNQAYAAEIRATNLQDPATIPLINGWVSDNTNGRITEIIKEADDDLVMLLINAIYFKGTWSYQFEENNTTDRDFTLLDGSVIQHPLMNQEQEFYYAETDDFQAISLPYGDGKVSMLVFLPSEETGLEGFLAKLSPASWQEWLGSLVRREGTIALPKFKLEYEKKLNDPLKQMDMGIAFDPLKADLTGMWDPNQPTDVGAAMANIQNLFIGEVKQKTFLEVNEEGTEAAAVTSIGIVATSAVHETQPPFQMVVDRPFFCAIVDKESGLAMFMGTIVDPR
jgi:serpin B